MEAQTIHFLGIDVETLAHKALLRFLNRKGVIAVQSNGEYQSFSEHCQVWVDTTFTEDELETLLYEKFRGYKGSSYVGVFTRKNYYKEEGYLFDKIESVPITN